MSVRSFQIGSRLRDIESKSTDHTVFESSPMADEKKAGNGEKWQALAILVASGSAVKDAATTLGMAERTAYRFASLPEFRRCVCRFRTEALDEAVGALNALTTKAIRKLDELLDTPDALGAIKTILANATKLAETVEFRERLDKLESER